MAVDGTRHWSGRSLRLRGGWSIGAILRVRQSGPYEQHRYRDRGNCDATADATLLHGESLRSNYFESASFPSGPTMNARPSFSVNDLAAPSFFDMSRAWDPLTVTSSPTLRLLGLNPLRINDVGVLPSNPQRTTLPSGSVTST